MTYYGGKELAEAFRTVRKNTIQIAEDIPEAHYGFRAAPEARTVAETLVHIAVGTRFQEQIQMVERRSSLAGFNFPAVIDMLTAEEKMPRSKAAILDLLRGEGEKFAEALEGLTEAFLGESVGLPPGMVPPSKTRFEMLLGPKEHEMHHRAQLMLMERMLGITPHLTRQMREREAAARAAQAGK